MKKLFLSCLFLLFFAVAQAVPAKSFYFTTSDSVKLYVRIAGEGKPCLFVHGGPGSWPKIYYALGGDVTEQDMTMIYLDQRGSGRSGGDDKTDYSLNRMVKDFEELREHLGYSKWLVMAHSFGGTQATEYAYQHPASINGVILVASTLHLKSSLESYIVEGARILNKPESEFRKEGASVGETLGKVVSQLNEQDLMYKVMYPKKEMFAQMNAVMDTTLNWHFGSKVWDLHEYEQDFTQKSASVKVPVLVVAGKYDYSVGPQHYRLFKFPKATYKTMATGHCPYQEQPEEFGKYVRKFVARLN
ncbi:alpha/beta fold hydrolase [Pontibacter ruber]|uniref:Alpha/beta fold hydrolase n=1 Tax=Pontibacter ruber TaxID=1343895 RepID=A0ABW5CXT9_9BACT|nr:alpha/beta hydrolase [Pontibacter ruber]